MTKKEAYQALSDLIYKGFLTMTLEMAGKLFVFKTINKKEYNLIKLYSGLSDNSTQFNLNYLIFSLFMVEEENILQKREEKIKDFLKFFYNIPFILYSKIFEELLSLRSISEEASQFIEGFSYTDQSRKMWRLMQNNLPNSEKFTGIPGTSQIGLNGYQESWILINKMLDEEERYNYNFSLAILVASASNPKGAKNIRARHDASVQKNEGRRKKLAKEGYIKKFQWAPKRWAAPVDTAEELVAELMRQIEGKKDRHDLFIEEHMRKLREEAEEQTRQAEKKLEEVRKKQIEEGIPAISGTQRAVTAEEIEKLTSKKSNLVVVKSDEIADKEQEKRFYSKIGYKILTARK